jgi:hypothetical protein
MEVKRNLLISVAAGPLRRVDGMEKVKGIFVDLAA